MNFIRLFPDVEDSLVWFKIPMTNDFIAKLGYCAQAELQAPHEKQWWWESLWKWHVPIKCKVVLWLALNNKLLTWDYG